LQSISARIVAKLLGLVDADPRGILFIGANSFIRELASVLKTLDIDVILTSLTKSDVRKARLEGLKCYMGNPASVHAEQNLELAGMGQMVAMSRRPEINALASHKFSKELGEENVYTLAEEVMLGDISESEKILSSSNAHILFNGELTLNRLLSYQLKGGVVKATLITQEFTLDHYYEHYNENVIPLLVIDKDRKITWKLSKEKNDENIDYTIVSIVFPDESSS